MATAEKTNAEFDTTKMTAEQVNEEMRKLRAAYEDGLIPANKFIKKQAELEAALRKVRNITYETTGELNRFANIKAPVAMSKANEAWARSWVLRGEAAKKAQEQQQQSQIIDDKSIVKKETAAERYKKVQKVIQDTQEAIAKAEKDYAATRFKIIKDSEDRVSNLRMDAARRQAQLVEQSMARITDAFRSATALSLGNLFGKETATKLVTDVKKLSSTLSVSVTKEVEQTTYKSIESVAQGLRDRIVASKKLLENASKLTGEGFSQTFIEQVLETGVETGNVLAESILNASPETKGELKTLFAELETVSETGADAIAKQIYDKFGLATKAMKDQSIAIQKELDDALIEEQKRLATELANAAVAFGVAMGEIKSKFLQDLGQFDGWFAGLKGTIDALIDRMGVLSGKAVTDTQKAITSPTSGTKLANATVQNDVAITNIKNAQGIVIDSMNDIAGTAAYIQARIAAANTYIKSSTSNAAQEASAAAQIASWTKELSNLKGSAAAGNVAGTIVNINVKTDTTQSQAMVGKTIGNIVTKYVTTGGQVLVSGNR